MSEATRFKPIRGQHWSQTADGQPTRDALLALISRCVGKRFARATNGVTVSVCLGPLDAEQGEEPPANPGHPACVEYADTAYCRESWRLHLAELSHRLETHWHRCNYDRLCAVVPVVHQGRCLAVIKLVCLPTVADEEFEQMVDLLDALVRGFEASEGEFLSRLPCTAGRVPASHADPPPTAPIPVPPQAGHDHIHHALRYIEEHLADPKLTVSRVARDLNVHPNYLGSLFLHQVGQRISRYIAGRRMALAQTLLRTTEWQIKRIAYETGHAKPNWFVHVFRACTGLTPGAYRRKWRGRSQTG